MPNSNTPKLSDTQLIILSSAAQREDGLAVLPEKLKGGAAKNAVTKLTGLGLLKEVRVKRDQPTWRTDEEDKPIGLKLTKAGSTAIEDDGNTKEEPAPKPKGRGEADREDASGTAESREPRAGSKQALIISLLQRKGGAAIAQMVEATGWLPHTTRAALTGLRQKGYAIEKSKNLDGVTVYRLDEAAASESGAADQA